MLDKLIGALRTRIPQARWPRPTKVEVLEKCGNTGVLIRAEYPGQRLPWGLYQQSGHAGAAVVTVEAPDGQYVALVQQWRPVDTTSIELPAANIGIEQDQLFSRLLKELGEEVGELEILEISTCPGFAHDVGREVVAGGGPKCFFPFIIRAKSILPPKRYSEGDEQTSSCFYPVEAVRQMVRDGRIGDIVTIYFLQLAGVVTTEDLGFVTVSA